MMQKLVVLMTFCLAVVAVNGVVLAQEQAVPDPDSKRPICVEFSHEDDLSFTAGGAPVADAERVNYTEPNDAAGPPFPHDSHDFGGDEQVDALANYGDAYYTDLKNNRAELLVSFDGDDPVFGHGVFGETTGGVPALVWKHKEFYFESNPALEDPLVDVDGLELWGPYSYGNPFSGWDANLFSLVGDPGGTSVWIDIGAGGQAFITQQQIFDRITLDPVNFDGTVDDIDVDALMARAYGGSYDTWDDGDEIIISIKDPLPPCTWDGGELVVVPFAGAPSFLSHGQRPGDPAGGHLWDTAFDIAGTFHVLTEEVDAIEAVRKDATAEWRFQHWDNPDITNLGPPANDLDVVLLGHHKIKDRVDDDFPEFQASWLYSPDATRLRWSGATVGTDETVHIGWSTWGRHRVRDMYWTLDGNRIPGSAIYILKPWFDRRLDGSFSAVLVNDFEPDGLPIEMIRIANVRYWVRSEGPLPLADLNETGTSGHLEPLTDPPLEYDVPPGEELSLVIPVSVPLGAGVILAYDVGTPGKAMAVTDYAQGVGHGPDRPDPGIPTVSEWGMVAMVLLVLAAGTIVFRRYRMAKAA